MAKLPAPENRAVGFFNTLIDNLVNHGKEVAIAAAVASQPWLGWPVINWLFKLIIDKIADPISKAVQRYGDGLIIKFQGEMLKGSYDDSIEKLRKFEEVGEIDTEEYKKAVEEARDAARKLIRRGR